MLLVSSSVLGMEPEHEIIHIGLHNVATTDTTSYITSLQSWQEFAKDHESVDEHAVLPQAIAEFQQKHEIKTDLAILPEAIQVWSHMKDSGKYSEGYKAEVLRIHALLRGYPKDIRPHRELADLKDVFLKKSYEQLELKKQSVTTVQNNFVMMRQWGIGLPVLAAVLFAALLLEMFLLPMSSNH